MSDIQLYHGDCLELMKNIPDHSVDLVLCDLPYGITDSSWDSIIPFDKLWLEYKRVGKTVFNVLLFCSGTFIYPTIKSNLEWYKYPLIWYKNRRGEFIHAKNRPMTAFEQICVFSPNNIIHASLEKETSRRMKYNPQGLEDCNIVHKHATKKFGNICGKRPSHKEEFTTNKKGYPSDVLCYNCPSEHDHPTQKPIDLLEFLIQSYSNEGDVVLDNCMGSGSTGVACVYTHRKFIGIEKETMYYRMASDRIECHKEQLGKQYIKQMSLL